MAGSFVFLTLITAFRILALAISATDLQVDEAQYWDWSREFAFGYFSKPPLIAWVIGLSTAVCQGGEACVRLPSPLFYFGTSLCWSMHPAAGSMAPGPASSPRSGLALAPGVALSSAIMSTDVLLLFFWALGLYAFLRLRDGGGARFVLLLRHFDRLRPAGQIRDGLFHRLRPARRDISTGRRASSSCRASSGLRS